MLYTTDENGQLTDTLQENAAVNELANGKYELTFNKVNESACDDRYSKNPRWDLAASDSIDHHIDAVFLLIKTRLDAVEMYRFAASDRLDRFWLWPVSIHLAAISKLAEETTQHVGGVLLSKQQLTFQLSSCWQLVHFPA